MAHCGIKHVNVCLNFYVVASGSFIAQPCTTKSNAICKCRGGFVARDKDLSTCQCNAGFGKALGGKEADDSILNAVNLF